MKNREIKFRVWDRGKKSMVYSGSDDFYYMSFKNDILGNIHGCHNMGGDPDSNIEDYCLMQFIGLKDKNGKEIYDGDIVKCLTELRSEPFIDFIRYDESFAGFTSDKHGSHIMQISGETFWIEVIGNIYENVGLLAVAP